jgi:hypothetical protein
VQPLALSKAASMMQVIARRESAPVDCGNNLNINENGDRSIATYKPKYFIE